MQDAHILLSSAVQDLSNNAYEIVIGGSENTISAIRRGSLGQTLFREHAQYNELRHFSSVLGSMAKQDS